ncbi:MAG: hypothetical protein IH840_00075 [Candidatus Heimdallarchaeota archaeon]|nr:hypothetical protein [Candidatus Heimdallarchaeota archaeon]
MAGIQGDATRLDSDRINQVVINGGVARRAAVHRSILTPGDQTYRQWIREDKTPLRTTLDPDGARLRSQFAYKYKDQPVTFIVDGLSYGRFELERVDKGVIPYDRQQSDLAAYFMQAEDRMFFAGDPMTPAGGKTGLANADAAPTIGTHFSLTASSQLDLTSITTMVDTLAKLIGQMADHFKERMMGYSLLLAVSPDVDDRINGFRDGTTGERMKPEVLGVLSENGDGGAAILRTSWLGATFASGEGNLPLKVTDGTTNAALLMWSETDPLYEVVDTGLILDSGVDELGNFNANFTEGYLPISYDPFSIVYSATVDITS